MSGSKTRVDKGALLPTNEFETWSDRVSKFYLIPEGPFMAYWDRFMVFVVVTNQALTALMAAFRQLSPSAFVVCYIIDIICYVDIFVKFHVAYLQGGFWVVIPSEMARHYMRSSEFFTDIASNLQLDLLALIWGCGTEQSLYYLTLIRLVKLLRALKIFKYFYKQEKKLHASFIVQLLKFVCFLLPATHLVSCLWFVMACPSGTPDSCLVESWVFTQELIDSSHGNRTFSVPLKSIYGYSVYWAVTTMTTTGYGDIRPANNAERILSIIAMTGGIFFFGYVSGTIASALSNMDSRRVSYQQKMDAVRQYMADRNMDPDMQERVLDYYDYVWERNRGIDVRNLFDDMPSTFKGEVALSLNNAIIDKATIFRKCSNGFRRLIAIHMKLYLFTANEYVIHKGDLGIEMFFITQGRIDVYATQDTKRPTSSLIEGAHFGEFQIILQHRHEYSARAVCNTDIYVLKKTDLDFAFSCYPEDRDLVRSATEERYNQAQNAKKSRKAKMDNDIDEDESLASMVQISKGADESAKNRRVSKGRRPSLMGSILSSTGARDIKSNAEDFEKPSARMPDDSEVRSSKSKHGSQTLDRSSTWASNVHPNRKTMEVSKSKTGNINEESAMPSVRRAKSLKSPSIFENLKQTVIKGSAEQIHQSIVHDSNTVPPTADKHQSLRNIHAQSDSSTNAQTGGDDVDKSR